MLAAEKLRKILNAESQIRSLLLELEEEIGESVEIDADDNLTVCIQLR